MSRGIADAGYGFAVLVVAGGVEGLFGEDLAGDGDDAVNDFQFHGPSGVLPADVDGASPARDAVLRDAAAWVDLVPSGGDGDIDSGRFDAFGDGDGPFAPQSVGVSRGGRNTKVRVVSDSESTLVGIHLSPGNGHDAAHGRRSMAAPGAFMGAKLLMDRVYEGDSTRLLAESFGLTPVVPPKRNRTDPWGYDRLDATFLANLQLILIAIQLKNTSKKN